MHFIYKETEIGISQYLERESTHLNTVTAF